MGVCIPEYLISKGVITQELHATGDHEWSMTISASFLLVGCILQLDLGDALVLNTCICIHLDYIYIDGTM